MPALGAGLTPYTLCLWETGCARDQMVGDHPEIASPFQDLHRAKTSETVLQVLGVQFRYGEPGIFERVAGTVNHRMTNATRRDLTCARSASFIH